MASLNISMPEELREFVDHRTRQTHHATPTEYIRSLVREDQKRAEQERIESLLVASIEHGKPITVTDIDEHFAKKKQLLLDKLQTNTKAVS